MKPSADERVRPQFQCSNPDCGESFGYPVKLNHLGIIIVTCSQCNTRSTVNLDPYRRNSIDIYRGDDQQNPDAKGEFDFPDRIPTEPYQEETDD